MPPGRLARHLPTTLGLGAAAIRMDKLIGLYQAHQAEASAILASYEETLREQCGCRLRTWTAQQPLAFLLLRR